MSADGGSVDEEWVISRVASWGSETFHKQRPKAESKQGSVIGLIAHVRAKGCNQCGLATFSRRLR